MNKLKPTWYCSNINEIDFSILKKKGIETILLDLDNTLVPVDCKKVDELAKLVLDNIEKSNLNVYIISNNHYDRVATFCDGTKALFLNDSRKPYTKRIEAFIIKENINKEKTVFIGDQLMTDIKLANKINVKSILVEPRAKKDLPITFFNRFLDKIIRKHNLKRNVYHKLGDNNE